MGRAATAMKFTTAVIMVAALVCVPQALGSIPFIVDEHGEKKKSGISPSQRDSASTRRSGVLSGAKQPKVSTASATETDDRNLGRKISLLHGARKYSARTSQTSTTASDSQASSTEGSSSSSFEYPMMQRGSVPAPTNDVPDQSNESVVVSAPASEENKTEEKPAGKDYFPFIVHHKAAQSGTDEMVANPKRKSQSTTGVLHSGFLNRSHKSTKSARNSRNSTTEASRIEYRLISSAPASKNPYQVSESDVSASDVDQDFVLVSSKTKGGAGSTCMRHSSHGANKEQCPFLRSQKGNESGSFPFEICQSAKRPSGSNNGSAESSQVVYYPMVGSSGARVPPANNSDSQVGQPFATAGGAPVNQENAVPVDQNNNVPVDQNNNGSADQNINAPVDQHNVSVDQNDAPVDQNAAPVDQNAAPVDQDNDSGDQDNDSVDQDNDSVDQDNDSVDQDNVPVDQDNVPVQNNVPVDAHNDGVIA